MTVIDRQHIISGLAPFNEERFKAAMAVLASRHEAPLDIYRLIKLHVMIDVLHVIKTGKPVIGGELAAWELGPVAPKAYGTVRAWIELHDRLGSDPVPLQILGTDARNKYERFVVRGPEAVDTDEFSQEELQTIEQAWKTIGLLSFKECKAYFHEPTASFIGAVWKKAWDSSDTREIDWRDLIEAYERDHGGDHRIAKLLVSL